MMDTTYITNSVQRQQREQLEQFILNFFGSEEAARAHAHLFVLEYDTDLTVKDDNTNTLSIHTTMRIRRKTEEELEQENH